MQKQFDFAPLDQQLGLQAVIGAVNGAFQKIRQSLLGAVAVELTVGAVTRTIYPSEADLTSITLTGNATLTLDTKRPRAGSVGFLEIIQDATGGRTVTWANAVGNAGAAAPSPAAGANVHTIFGALYTGTHWVLWKP
jgi:hypothetical protein